MGMNIILISHITKFCFVKGFFFLCFQDRVSLYSHGCPGTHSVDQAGLELRNSPASASQSAGITGVCHQCLANLLFFVL